MIRDPARAVIFDLDGTLLDTLDDLADSMNTVLRDHGLPPHPVDSYRRFVGDGVTNLVLRALPETARARADREPAWLRALVEAMRSEYGRRWSGKTRPYPGVPELLAALRGRGIRLAVLSNKPHDFCGTITDHFLGRHTFDRVLGARAGVPHKPDPAGVLEILKAFGLPATAVLYVGDSSTDMDTARAAGLVAVGVLWGFRSRDELTEHGATILLDHPGDLLGHLGGRS